MEEAQTLRPPKKSRSELVVVIWALKKPEVYLKVKWNYSFHVQMVSLIETLDLEMVKRMEDGSSVGEAHEVGQGDGVGVGWRRIGEVGVQRRGTIRK